MDAVRWVEDAKIDTTSLASFKMNSNLPRFIKEGLLNWKYIEEKFLKLHKIWHNWVINKRLRTRKVSHSNKSCYKVSNLKVELGGKSRSTVLLLEGMSIRLPTIYMYVRTTTYLTLPKSERDLLKRSFKVGGAMLHSLE